MKSTAKTNVKPTAKAATPRRAKPVPRSGVAAPIKPEDKPLDYREQRFVDLYLASEKLDPYQAALDAGYAVTVAKTKAYGWVSKSESKPHVYKAIRAGMERISKEANIDQQAIVKGLLNEITADPNDLVQYRRPPCRCCYGVDNRYQFTPNEMEQAKKKHAEKILIATASRIKLTPDESQFDEQGGLGYDPRREPNPDCPECFGEGKGEIFLHDTRKMGDKAKSIYAGVHQGKDGLKMILKNQNDARTLLMRHAGMLNDKLKLQGDAENPLIALIKAVSGTGLKPVANPSDDE